MKIRPLLTLMIIAIGFMATPLRGQLSLGFKAGLSYSKLDGPSETDDHGMSIDNYEFTSGFQIGVIFNYAFTDLVGIRSELLFSQRSARYNFDGLGYFIFTPDKDITATGDKELRLSVNNTFVDIPMMAYYKFGKFEIAGGFNLGFLASSKADGFLTFSGISDQGGGIISRFEQRPVHNYFRDDINTFEVDEPFRVDVDGVDITVPDLPGAYFEYRENVESLYKKFEFALLGNLSYFVNDGLSLGARIHYGFTDMTNDETDISRGTLDENKMLITRDDDDRYLSFQVHISFFF